MKCLIIIKSRPIILYMCPLRGKDKTSSSPTMSPTLHLQCFPLCPRQYLKLPPQLQGGKRQSQRVCDEPRMKRYPECYLDVPTLLYSASLSPREKALQDSLGDPRVCCPLRKDQPKEVRACEGNSYPMSPLAINITFPLPHKPVPKATLSRYSQ